MQTLDGYEIEDGMRVWDYDLDPVTVELGRVREEHNQNNGEVTYWFDVRTLTGGRKLMSDTRVWKFHPSTGDRP